MNLLYPNFLKGIDHYLKINYPHVWRTRVHDFGWFSLILGNILAFGLGILVVGRDNILNEGTLTALQVGLGVLLGFIVLFWAMRLLHFKIKFSNFKAMLTTWAIYVLCVVSLGLNLATFIYSIAYKTACIYSDKMLQTDYDYLEDNHYIGSFKSFDEYPYEINILKPEHVTDNLLIIMQRYGHEVNTNKVIRAHHVGTVRNNIKKFVDVKTFVRQPIFKGDFSDSEKRTAFHELLKRQWKMVIGILFFLPTILFLISIFGMKNILISGFCTGLIVGLTDLIMESFGPISSIYMMRAGLVPMTYIAITFVLMLILLMGRHRLRSWNYIASVFMLMIGVLFLKCPGYLIGYFVMTPLSVFSSSWIIPIAQLAVSLLISLIAAWLIAKRNNQYILH